MRGSLPILNLDKAHYECIYGRGCDGICCQNGRPGIDDAEHQRIDANLHKFLPLLRPEAQRLVEDEGYLSGRVKQGQPMLRVVKGWCVFFNQGCVLHKVGAVEGDKYLYKPLLCSVFPLDKDERGRWYMRQHGYSGEKWDLFCLDPNASPLPAAQTLTEEIELVAQRG